MIKSRRNYSPGKVALNIDKLIAEMLTDMAKWQNESIQSGIDNKRDIEGKPFTALSKDSTLPIRNRRKQGFTPLDRMKGQRQKKLRNTRVYPATQKKHIAIVEMQTSYGVYHNEGFTTGPKSMIPGKKVPARNWFGISKEVRPGGRKYKVFVKTVLMDIGQAMKKQFA